MSRRCKFAVLGSCAFLIFTASFAVRADTGIKTHFDLPAETLDESLRDFAVQAHCNISYEPSVVKGFQAPAVNGEFTAEEALGLILAGTRLTTVNLNENTIRVVKKPTSGAISPASQDSEKSDLEEIVVTGSHIRGVASASPVIDIGRDEIERSGYTSISDLMLSVPQNFGGGYSAGGAITNSHVNGRYSDNFTGATSPNLRGLGPGSTLTLIDGHRMASGLSAGGVDISSIPLDAIERIEVVTDGASSVYGSDAVAGVVNIILRKDYQGASSDINYGFASQGGATERGASQLFGTDWTSGNVMLAYEFREQDVVDARQRAFTSTATDPYSLLPQTKSNSVTLSVRQDLSARASAFAEGLYVTRDADSFVSQAGLPGPIADPSMLNRYAVTGGINASVSNDWNAVAFVDAARDSTASDSSFVTAPALIPAGSIREIGTLQNGEINANGTVVDLPTGPTRLAVGAGYRHESFTELFGLTPGNYAEQDRGHRNILYEFFELSVPLVERSVHAGLDSLDLMISARDERYSDFGNKAVPKVGLVYSPAAAVKLRSTWSRAFRAPNLEDMHEVQQLYLIDLADPASASGTAPTLIKFGGNPSLQPETADTFTLGVDYSPPTADGLRLSATGFDIRYSNRIAQIVDPFAALTDPSNAFFVVRSPSAALAQAVYNSYPATEIANETAGPFVANSIAALVDDREVNVSRQTARGADLTASYRMGEESAGFLFFFNGSYLDLTQQNTPESPTQTESGLAFYPAKFRGRGGVTWNRSGWSLTGTANYLAHEMNTQVSPAQSVASWTTFDASLRYAPTLSGLLSGLHFSLSAVNVFNKNPPRVIAPADEPGVNLDYDTANANPLGRFVSLAVSKKW